MAEPLRCAVCGRILPNRWAVAGTCEEDGCGSVFCALHYRNGNRRCPTHGWEPRGVLAPPNGESKTENAETLEIDKVAEVGPEGSSTREEATPREPAEAKKSVLKALVDGAFSIGAGAKRLVNEIRGVHSPEDAIKALDEQLKQNSDRRMSLAKSHEALLEKIALKQKDLLDAAPERKPLLEIELGTMLEQYQSEERQLRIYLENEHTINVVRGRTQELMAMGLRTFSEKDLDEVTADVEKATAEAERSAAARRDLERIGRVPEPEFGQPAYAGGSVDLGTETANSGTTVSESVTSNPVPSPASTEIR